MRGRMRKGEKEKMKEGREERNSSWRERAREGKREEMTKRRSMVKGKQRLERQLEDAGCVAQWVEHFLSMSKVLVESQHHNSNELWG